MVVPICLGSIVKSNKHSNMRFCFTSLYLFTCWNSFCFVCAFSVKGVVKRDGMQLRTRRTNLAQLRLTAKLLMGPGEIPASTPLPISPVATPLQPNPSSCRLVSSRPSHPIQSHPDPRRAVAITGLGAALDEKQLRWLLGFVSTHLDDDALQVPPPHNSQQQQDAGRRMQ